MLGLSVNSSVAVLVHVHGGRVVDGGARESWQQQPRIHIFHLSKYHGQDTKKDKAQP